MGEKNERKEGRLSLQVPAAGAILLLLYFRLAAG